MTDDSRKSLKRTCLAAAALALAPALASAQNIPVMVGAGAGLEWYTFLEADAANVESLSLLTLPFGARVSPLSRLRFDVRGAYARGTLVRADDSDATISGLTDTELSAAVLLGRDLATVSVILLAPTGHSTHTTEEAEVAGAIASDLLPFRISNWGSGGGIGVGTTLTVPMGDFGVGISAGYAVATEYEPLEEDQLTYRPGNELRVQLGIDRLIGNTTKASVVLSMQRYDDDELAGQNLFRAGNRYQATGSLSFAARSGTMSTLYAGALSRGAGTLTTVEETETARQLLLLAGGGMRVPLSQWTLVPSGDVRVFTRSDDVGNGYIVGLGVAAEWTSGSLTLVPAARTRFGELQPVPGVESTIWGGEVSFTIRGAGGRQ